MQRTTSSMLIGWNSAPPSPAMGMTGMLYRTREQSVVKKPSPGPKMRLGRRMVKGTPAVRTACSAIHFV